MNKEEEKFALILKEQRGNSPIIRVLLMILELLMYYEIKKREMNDDDPARFLLTYGFSQEDRQRIIAKNMDGSGLKSRQRKTEEILQLIGFAEKYRAMFGSYNILLEFLDVKKYSSLNALTVEKVINLRDQSEDRNYIFSENGRHILASMYKIFEPTIHDFYSQYFY